MGSFIELTASDGHRFSAWQATPAGTARGAVVIAPEIFGVNGHIRSVADGYAADGYLAIAPSLFDRAQRDYQTGYTPDDVQAGIAIMQAIDPDDALKDLAATIAHAQAAGRVAMVGYCWGGTLAWLAAARLEGLACSVPYYGGGMPRHMREQPRCPVLCHFGEHDKSPTPEQARELLALHPEVAAHFYDAGHGFNCDQRGSYNAQASQLARSRTLAFLAHHVGSPRPRPERRRAGRPQRTATPQRRQEASVPASRGLPASASEIRTRCRRPLRVRRRRVPRISFPQHAACLLPALRRGRALRAAGPVPLRSRSWRAPACAARS